MGPDPILKTIMSTIIQVTINRDWEEWMDTCGHHMPHLHFHYYSFNDRIWNLLAEGATEFNNINVLSDAAKEQNITDVTKEINALMA